MSAPVVDRALVAALKQGYGAQMIHALLRMAHDADGVTGENCTTSLERIQAAAGYASDSRFKSARRAREQFIQDGVIRLDVEAPGIGFLCTVCPVGPWSGDVPNRNDWFRRLIACRKTHEPDLDTHVQPALDTDVQPGLDSTLDTAVSNDLRTYEPKTDSPLAVSEGSARAGDSDAAGNPRTEKESPWGETAKSTAKPRAWPPKPYKPGNDVARKRYGHELASYTRNFTGFDDKQVEAVLLALKRENPKPPHRGRPSRAPAPVPRRPHGRGREAMTQHIATCSCQRCMAAYTPAQPAPTDRLGLARARMTLLEAELQRLTQEKTS